MSFQISISHNNRQLTYIVTSEENEVYLLHSGNAAPAEANNDLPRKMMVPKKGKLWISDLEDHKELVEKLTNEISNFSASNKVTS